jgi:hypothetical protein
MVPCFKWQSVLCIAFLTQAATAWAQQELGPKQQLRFGPVAEMKRRGQTASVDFRAQVKLTLRKTNSGYIGQPNTFEVEIHNAGTHPTTTDASLLIRIGIGNDFATEEYGWRFGVVAPKEKQTVRFEYKPLLPSLELVVTEGIWDSRSMGWTQVRAEKRFSCQYDPMVPLTDFLPVRPHTVKRQAMRLPTKLSEVPEVFFGEPLTNTGGRIQLASALAKIKHVNQKKTDAYMELLLSQRSDLAGLPFVLRDACRRKGESRAHFATTTKQIRDIQRSGAVGGAGSIPGDFTENRQMTEVVKILGKQRPPAPVQVAALWQMITPESAGNRLELVKYLQGSLPEVDSARALAKLAIYSEEERIRSAALDALKTRRKQEYADILLKGLSYPWPAVAERASAAIAKLGRADLVPQLREVLKRPDPRLPQGRLVDGKRKTSVRELVRTNHLHNCMLCHAPAAPGDGNDAGALAAQAGNNSGPDLTHPKEDDSTAQVPIPGEPIQQYYGGTIPDLLVRFDVTYLRQDFSVTLPVEKADPWPRMQRYDFVVRTREVSEQEARVWRELLPADAASPYHRAARAAIEELLGRKPDVK